VRLHLREYLLTRLFDQTSWSKTCRFEARPNLVWIPHLLYRRCWWWLELLVISV